MSKTSIPKNYHDLLGLYDTQRAIGIIKTIFQEKLCAALHLKRVTAPLFVLNGSGLNDDLNGVERPVSFDVPCLDERAEVVHSLAKWKRYALAEYGEPILSKGICRLPQGYDTVIAEDGGNISQGQKQLLCIARVMLRKPPILILDEATSSIDTRTEVLVQDAFEELMKGRTSFIVAHRLSTIKNADQILVMKAGNIIERGTHEELLARGGFYANLYASQFAKA